MNPSPIFQPIVALALLTFVMWFWLYATRIPATLKMKLDLDPNMPPKDLMNQMPPRVRWKADNYNHLFEQPTVFFAIALTLAMLGAGDGLNLTLAWAYVGLRVAHSIFHAFINVIMVRFIIFNLSSLVLLALTIRAAIIVFCQTPV